MTRPQVLLALLAAVLSACAACDLNDKNGLGKCVRGILESSRAALSARFDPLRLKDQVIRRDDKGLSWKILNARVFGLGTFDIRKLEVKRIPTKAFSVKFGVVWKKLVGTGYVQMRLCPKIFGKRRCFDVDASPRIAVQNPAAALKTQLALSYKNGQLHVKPQGTKIFINLEKIDVQVSLQGLLGMLDKMLGYPSKKLANELSTRWWKKEKNSIEDKAREQLHQLIYKNLSPKLEKLLLG